MVLKANMPYGLIICDTVGWGGNEFGVVKSFTSLRPVFLGEG